MARSVVIGVSVGLVLLLLAGFAGWMLSLPATRGPAAAPDIPQAEVEEMLAALKPGKRARPLVAIVGINDATETTDYPVPPGILRRANIADVMMLATEAGPVELYPALTVEPDATLAEFDAAHADGADYVIVPAMRRDDDPAVLSWLRAQADKGAIIIGICAGAKVVAAAGLLEDKRATTHWYYLGALRKLSPNFHYVPDRRMVADGKVITTTGISASIPMMLTLIEAIGGRDKAGEVARALGVETWDARHASAAFGLSRDFSLTVLANRLAFWRHEGLGIRLEPGMDEVALALVADAWSRTYRASIATYSAKSAQVETRNGIRIIPDQVAEELADDRAVSVFSENPPVDALDATLSAIAARYGTRTRDMVAMQLEYAGQAER